VSYEPLFECTFVQCKQKNPRGKVCGHRTRLPLPNPLDIETHLINSPTEAAPLIVLCNRCWKVSRYIREDFEKAIFPASALSGYTPFYLVEIVCGEIGCGLPTRVYTRGTLALTEHLALSYVMKALGGLEALCPVGHPLAQARTLKKFQMIQEHLGNSL